MSAPTRRSFIILGALGALAGSLLGWWWAKEDFSGPHFELVDQGGRARTDADYLGKVVLLYFGYTFCPDVCPTELGHVARVMRALGPAGDQVVPVFVTIDPERDTPAKLADYVRLFDERMVGLSGSPAQIASAARAYGAFYQRVDVVSQQPGYYLMNHSSTVLVLDRRGRLVDQFDSHVAVADAVARIQRQL